MLLNQIEIQYIKIYMNIFYIFLYISSLIIFLIKLQNKILSYSNAIGKDLSYIDQSIYTEKFVRKWYSECYRCPTQALLEKLRYHN